MGPAPLSWTDLGAMERKTGRDLTASEARALFALDRAYLSAALAS